MVRVDEEVGLRAITLGILQPRGPLARHAACIAKMLDQGGDGIVPLVAADFSILDA
jgi:hypothetical protein